MADELLFHIKRTTNNLDQDPTGSTEAVAILGTYTDLSAAKRAAKTALLTSGYEQSNFETYDVKDGSTAWPHADALVVFAKTTAGATVTVALETTPNDAGVAGNAEGKVDGELFHVLQTTIYYNLDKGGSKRETSIAGSYQGSEEARERARGCLLDEDVTRESFEVFEEAGGQEGWEYGEDVVVRAVAVGGEGYLVAVVKG